jgi:hypothetical protein
MPKPIRRCIRCFRILPPWARADTRLCGNVCRQAAHRERHQWRRRETVAVQVTGPKLRERQVQIDDIEQLIALTDATVARVMANVAKIRTKPDALMRTTVTMPRKGCAADHRSLDKEA